MSEALKASCDTCKFSRSHPTFKAEMNCLRFPPQVVIASKGPISAFPSVNTGWWCGEHALKPELVQ